MSQSPGRAVDALLERGAQPVRVVVQRAVDELDLEAAAVALEHGLDLVAEHLAADDLGRRCHDAHGNRTRLVLSLRLVAACDGGGAAARVRRQAACGSIVLSRPEHDIVARGHLTGSRAADHEEDHRERQQAARRRRRPDGRRHRPGVGRRRPRRRHDRRRRRVHRQGHGRHREGPRPAGREGPHGGRRPRRRPRAHHDEHRHGRRRRRRPLHRGRAGVDGASSRASSSGRRRRCAPTPSSRPTPRASR